MKYNSQENSSFSFKEIKNQKEKDPKELMPPPRIPTKNSKDIISELRKNLFENGKNDAKNKELQEELNKIKQMNKDLIEQNKHINSNEIENSFFDLDNSVNFNNSNLDEEIVLNNSIDFGKEKEKDTLNKLNKLPIPKNKSEIRIFVSNIICYINYLLSWNSTKNNSKLNDELINFRHKLEIRYNDYKNGGLDESYFIKILSQNQEELISKLKEMIKSETKEEKMYNYINNIENYSFIGKKRKKSLSEIKSVTDGSSSYEGNWDIFDKDKQ